MALGEQKEMIRNGMTDCANSVGPSVKSDKMMSGPIKVLILPVRSPVKKMTTVYCRPIIRRGEKFEVSTFSREP